MNIITIRCTQRCYIEKLVGTSMWHQDTQHVPETGAWRTATIALTWVLSIAYIINACEYAGARHGIRGVLRGTSRGGLRTYGRSTGVHTSAAAGQQSEGEAGHRQIRVARPLQPAPNKPHTARYSSLVSSPENDPATNHSRKREDDCPQLLNSCESDRFMAEILPYTSIIPNGNLTIDHLFMKVTFLFG